jgi:hypothetical protein
MFTFFKRIMATLSETLGLSQSPPECCNEHALEKVLTLPKSTQFHELLLLAREATRRHDFAFQHKVLKAIGELGNDDSVEFIVDWLGHSSQQASWPALVQGISEAADNPSSMWRERVFDALKEGLSDDTNSCRFAAWPGVSWPAAMMNVDYRRSIGEFQASNLFDFNAPGFEAVLEAINQSPDAVIPPEVAHSWLPASMPSCENMKAMDNYLLQLRTHVEYDTPEAKRRLWEVVERCPSHAQQAAGLIARLEGLPEPVWQLDSRVQKVGLEQVNTAERIVWIVANWFTFALRCGSIQRYASNYEADHLPKVIHALAEIGASRTSYCLRQLALLLGPEWPASQYERENIIAAQQLDLDEEWESLIRQHECHENVVSLNLTYQMAHRTEFEAPHHPKTTD